MPGDFRYGSPPARCDVRDLFPQSQHAVGFQTDASRHDVRLAEWVATTLWELAQRGDAWLSLMTTGPHRLASVSVGNFQCDMAPRATAKTSIKTLLFELERQQVEPRESEGARERGAVGG
eukprot:908846-Rhodomonas_salina.4